MAGKPGRSGRKPKAEQYADVYAATARELHALLPEVAPSLRELVIGIYTVEDRKDGQQRIYQQPPNVKAIELLLNRTVGQVPKPVELTGADGGPIVLSWDDGSEA